MYRYVVKEGSPALAIGNEGRTMGMQEIDTAANRHTVYEETEGGGRQVVAVCRTKVAANLLRDALNELGA